MRCSKFQIQNRHQQTEPNPEGWGWRAPPGPLWVGRWSSGGVEFTIRSSRVTWRGERKGEWGQGEGGHAISAFYSFKLQATGRGGGVKRIIRKWIRLSPFPLLHQPGKEIQRGNLKEEKKKQMEVSQNRNWQGEKKEQTGNLSPTQKPWQTDAGSSNATFDTNADVRLLWNWESSLLLL